MSAKRKILSGHLLSWQDSRSGSPLPQHRDGEKEGCQPEAVDAQAVARSISGGVFAATSPNPRLLGRLMSLPIAYTKGVGNR